MRWHMFHGCSLHGYDSDIPRRESKGAGSVAWRRPVEKRYISPIRARSSTGLTIFSRKYAGESLLGASGTAITWMPQTSCSYTRPDHRRCRFRGEYFICLEPSSLWLNHVGYNYLAILILIRCYTLWEILILKWCCTDGVYELCIKYNKQTDLECKCSYRASVVFNVAWESQNRSIYICLYRVGGRCFWPTDVNVYLCTPAVYGQI